MKVEVFDDKKLVCVWLSHKDQNDPALQERLKPLYQEYKQKKYLVSVFYSGHEDIEGLTPKQIQDKFALPQQPIYACDVEIPKGVVL